MSWETSRGRSEQDLRIQLSTCMHILIFHQYFSVPSGSSSTRTYAHAKHLLERGHRVTVVTGCHSRSGFTLPNATHKRINRGEIEGLGILQIDLPYSNYDSLPRRALTFLRFAWHSMRIALKTDCDLILATSTPLTIALPALAARWLRKRSYIFEVRDLWPELPKAMGVVRNPLVLAALGWLETRAYRNASGLIGLSPGMVEGIKRKARPETPIALLPNSADTATFQPGPQRSARKGLKAVFTGAHGLANGLDAVLDAARILQEMGRTDITLELIGEGSLKPALQERTSAEALTGVRFLDPMPRAELAAYLQEVDAGLMILANVPAFYNGTSPNKFFDYLASGLPVLTNYPGWVAELVTGADCGLAVPPADPRAFAEALCLLADQPEKRLQMGKHARRLALEAFDRSSIAGQLADFLEQTMEPIQSHG